MEGFIHGGAYSRNFTVLIMQSFLVVLFTSLVSNV